MGIRRVVTGHNSEGKAVFASDEEVEPVTVSLVPGWEWHQVWGIDETARFPDDRSNMSVWCRVGWCWSSTTAPPVS